jgi:hypothetical protein
MCRRVPPEMTARDSFPWETKGVPIRANAADGYAHSSDKFGTEIVPFAPGILMQARRLAPGAASLRFRHAGPMRVSGPKRASE